VISLLQRLLPNNKTTLQIDICTPGGTRTRNYSEQAATDQCLRLCGYWDWLDVYSGINSNESQKFCEKFLYSKMPRDIPCTSHIPQMKVYHTVFILESCTLVSIIQKTVLKIVQLFSKPNIRGLLHLHEKNLWPSLIAEKMRYLGNASGNPLYVPNASACAVSMK